MEIRYLLQVLREYRLLLAVSALVAGLLALGATYVLPEKFEATTEVLIRPRTVPSADQAQKQMMDYPVSFNIPVDTMSKTYAAIMTSEAIAIRVIDALGLDDLTPPRDPRRWMRAVKSARDYVKLGVVRTWEFVRYGRVEQQDPYRETVENVMKGLEASPITDTFLFTLTGRARDPELAAHIANTAADVFIEYTREVRTDEDGTGVRDIRRRLETVSAGLSRARTALQEFGEGTTAGSLDREIQLRVDERSNFEAEREDLRREVGGIEAESGTLEEQLAAERESVPSRSTVARNPVVAEIETLLARSEVELAGLSSTLQPDHPRMRELSAQIDEAKRRLATERHKVPDTDTSEINQTREQINQRLLERRARRSAAVASLTALDRTIREYRDDIAALTAQKGDLAQLLLDIEVRENEVRLLNREEAEASLSVIQQIGEIRQLNLATPPVYPSGPIKIYYTVAGVVMGLLLALTAVLLLDYTDPRVRDADELQAAFGVPLLGVVPHAAPVRSLGPDVFYNRLLNPRAAEPRSDG
jgi:uncharacterized protein involved in exopolysaccharide biosynthesis